VIVKTKENSFNHWNCDWSLLFLQKARQFYFKIQLNKVEC